MEFHSVITRIKKLLLEEELTIATAESLTAGMISSYLASISGSSGYLVGGVAAYTINIKAKVLGVDEQMAIDCNAYSAKVAEQMVEGVCKLFESQIGISTTGYAESSADNNIKVPQAFVAISINGKISTTQIIAEQLPRNEARDYIAKQALLFLLDNLERIKG